MPDFPSFTKALMAYFGDDRKVSVPEMKELTTDDKLELSRMLNDAGFTHEPYKPVAPKE